jgi:hypothetical protein
MRLPSGDQRSSPKSAPSAVSCRAGCEPSAATVNTSYQPGDSSTNASDDPSGDHAGLRALRPGVDTSATSLPVAMSVTCRLVQLRSSRCSSVEATRVASGDTRASPRSPWPPASSRGHGSTTETTASAVVSLRSGPRSTEITSRPSSIHAGDEPSQIAVGGPPDTGAIDTLPPAV